MHKAGMENRATRTSRRSGIACSRPPERRLGAAPAVYAAVLVGIMVLGSLPILGMGGPREASSRATSDVAVVDVFSTAGVSVFPNTTTSITFKATIRNNGTSAVTDDFQARLVVAKLGSGLSWSDNKTVTADIAPNATTTVTFSAYSVDADETGSYDAIVTSMLSSDENATNNESVMHFAIIPPKTDAALSGATLTIGTYTRLLGSSIPLPENTTMTPSVTLENVGTEDMPSVQVNFTVTDSLGSVVYSDIMGPFTLNVSEERTLTFADWSQSGSGMYDAVMNLFPADDDSDNDYAGGPVQVLDNLDITCMSVLYTPIQVSYLPSDSVDFNMTVTNTGNKPIAAGYVARINISYYPDPALFTVLLPSENSPALAQGATAVVDFAPFSLGALLASAGLDVMAGDYAVHGEVVLSGDFNPFNDRTSDAYLRLGGFHDVYVENPVLDPSGVATVGNEVRFSIDVGNHGDAAEDGLMLTYTVYAMPAMDIAAQSTTPKMVSALDPGEVRSEQLDESWNTEGAAPGEYMIELSVLYTDTSIVDANAADNSLNQTLLVTTPLDVMVSVIESPKFTKVGWEETVKVLVYKSEGQMAEPLLVELMIKNVNGSLLSNETAIVTINETGWGEHTFEVTFQSTGTFIARAAIMNAWGDYNLQNNEMLSEPITVVGIGEPFIVLASPNEGATYFAGQPIRFDATGTTDDTTLAENLKYTWKGKPRLTGYSFTTFATGAVSNVRMPYPMTMFGVEHYGTYDFQLWVEDAEGNNLSYQFTIDIAQPLVSSAARDDLNVVWAGPDSAGAVGCVLTAATAPPGASAPADSPSALGKYYDIQFSSTDWFWMGLELDVLDALGGPIQLTSLKFYEYADIPGTRAMGWTEMPGGEPVGAGFYLRCNTTNDAARDHFIVGVFGREEVVTGTISGRLVDESGNPVPNALITLTLEGAVVATYDSDISGTFIFNNLEAGEYDIDIQSEGTFVHRTVVLKVGETQTPTITVVRNFASMVVTVVEEGSDPPKVVPEASIVLIDMKTQERYPPVLTDQFGKVEIRVPATNQTPRYRLNITHSDYLSLDEDVFKPMNAMGIILDPIRLSYRSLPPVLEQASVSPLKGDTAQDFTFTVVYRDMDGDAAKYVNIYIDNKPFTMAQTSGTNATSGITYQYKTNFPQEGEHFFFFKCEDIHSKSAQFIPSQSIKVEDENIIQGPMNLEGTNFYLFLAGIAAAVAAVLIVIIVRNKVVKRKMDKQMVKKEEEAVSEPVSEVMCTSCGAPIQTGAAQCAQCGVNLATLRHSRTSGRRCPLCKALNDPRAHVCRGCGKDLSGKVLRRREALDDVKELESDRITGMDFSIEEEKHRDVPMDTVDEEAAPAVKERFDIDGETGKAVEPSGGLDVAIDGAAPAGPMAATQIEQTEASDDTTDESPVREPLAQDVQCPTCRAMVPAGSLECPACGETEFNL